MTYLTNTSKLMALLCLLALSVLIMPHSAKADIMVGDKVPHDLSFKDQNGKARSFDNLVGSKGLVLVFVRSVQWCPFCQKQLLELNESAQRFEDAGYPIVTISYDTPDAMAKFVTKNNPKITLLSDARSESIRAFGIFNTEAAKGTRSYGIPYPGSYIISKDKKVQAKFFKDGYKNRASAQELLTKIEALNPKPKPKKPFVPVKDLEGLGEDPILPGEDVIEVPEKIEDDILSPNGSIAPIEEDLSMDTLPVKAEPIDDMPPKIEAMPIESGEMKKIVAQAPVNVDEAKIEASDVEPTSDVKIEAKLIVTLKPAIKTESVNDGFGSMGDMPPPPAQSAF